MTALFFARRLSLGNDPGHSSPAVKVATAAVALSVAVMIAAIAIVLGFKQQITEKIIGFNSHLSLQIIPDGGENDNILTLNSSLQKVLDDTPYISGYSISLSIPAVIKTDEDFKGVYIRSGAEPNMKQLLKESLIQGEIPDFSKTSSDSLVVVSKIVADKLNLKTGQRINLYFFTDQIRVRPLKIAAVFNSHLDAYDDVYIFSAPSLLQQLGNLKLNQGTAIVINTDNFDNIDQYTSDLQYRLNEASKTGWLFRHYIVDNTHKSGGNFFQWFRLLDMNVAVVIVIMLIVGCVTLVSGLLIIIADKKHFISLIKSLGANESLVRKIFLLLAMRVALTGMIIGDTLIIALLLIQKHTHFIPLNPDSYYIDFVPVLLSWQSILLLNLGVMVISYLVLILPTRFVGRISPAEVLR